MLIINGNIYNNLTSNGKTVLLYDLNIHFPLIKHPNFHKFPLTFINIYIIAW